MQEHYLAKWLNGELSPEELQEFKKSEAYASYAKIIEASNKLEAPAFDANAAFAQIKTKTQQQKTKVIPLKPMRAFLRIAAVLAIVFTTYWFVISRDTQVVTQMAQQTQIVLPDASQINLNADSRVAFNKRNWNDEREVSLEGEAFFEVAKGKKFDVATSQGIVSVLGTEFNIKSRANYFQVTCFEGLVSVTYKETTVKLPAGKSFLVIDNTIIPTQVTQQHTPTWLHNESTFKSIPLRYVLNELERQYNISVEAKDIDTNQLFTGSFANNNLSLALQSISNPLQVAFTVADNKVVLYEVP